MVDKFHDYLYGVKFTVRTDNNPLTYVLTSAKLNATGHRWLEALATYDFDIQYRPGRHNIDADLLSRQHENSNMENWTNIPAPGIKAICRQVGTAEKSTYSTRLADQLGVSPIVIPKAYVYPITLGTSTLEELTPKELKVSQDLDPFIGPVK